MIMPEPPRIKSIGISHLALPRTVVMPNGVLLYVLEGGTQEVVRLDFLFSGGYAIQQLPLQALFTNRMLREGCTGCSGEEIARKLDYCGAWIDMYSSQNCNHITLYALSKHIPAMVELLASMVKQPLFPERNLEIVRRNNKSHYQISSRKVEAVAQRYFEQALWGKSHSLGHIVVADDYDNITRDILVDYHQKVYNSHNCTLFVSGKVDEKTVDTIRAAFGADTWGGENVISDFVPDAPASLLGRKKVVLPEVMQSAVKVGCMVADASHDDFLKLRFMTVLFGGYFGSRLMSNIRERNGYTYHIQAELDAYGKRNALMISTETANETVEPLLAEIYNEMARLRTETVPQEELELVRNYTIGELCREYEGIMAKADVFINTWLSGERFDSVNKYLDVIRDVSSSDIKNLANRYLLPESMCEIVVGA